MNTLLIGNIIAFFGAAVMICTGFVKKPSHIITMQCAQFSLMGIGNLVLGGVSGFITNIVSIVRNLVCLKFAFNTKLKITFIVLQILIAWIAGISGVLGLLPILSSCIFTWFLDTEDELVMKAVIIGTLVMWIVYDFSLKNYTGFVFDLFTVVTNTYGAFRILSERRKAEAETTAA